MFWTIKLSRQQALVLNALRAAGRAGVLNAALVKISFRYGARVFELSKRGWKIECDKVKGGGLFRYHLVSEPNIPGLDLKIDSPIELVSGAGTFAGRKIAGHHEPRPDWMKRTQ